METFIRNFIEENIKNKNLKMSVSSVKKVEDRTDHIAIVKLHGGANGHGRLTNYLSEIKAIVDLFNDVVLVNWRSDIPDDVYDVTLSIKL